MNEKIYKGLTFEQIKGILRTIQYKDFYGAWVGLYVLNDFSGYLKSADKDLAIKFSEAFAALASELNIITQEFGISEGINKPFTYNNVKPTD